MNRHQNKAFSCLIGALNSPPESERVWGGLRTERVSKELADVMRLIFYTSQFPAETHYRTCDGLLQLQRTADPAIFRTACETAIRLERYSLGFIRQMVESKCAGVLTEDLPLFAPPEHANIRGKEQFK